MAGMMTCDEHGQMPLHEMPCNHECCLGVLGCAALASDIWSVIPTAFFIPKTIWPRERHPDGLAIKPALRPPIV